jgi:hypothetical protein
MKTQQLQETMSRTQFGALHGVSRVAVNRWLKRGQAVLAEGADRIEVARSNKLLASRCDVYRGGKASDVSRKNGRSGLDSLSAEEAATMEAAAGVVLRSLAATQNDRCTIDAFAVALDAVLRAWAEAGEPEGLRG